MFKAPLAFAIALIATVTPAFGRQAATEPSPDPAKAALIQELFRLTKPETMTQQILAQQNAAMRRTFAQLFRGEFTKSDTSSKFQPALD